MDSNDEAWKVFWCEHLSPVMLGEIPEGQREAYFRTLSQRQLLVPGGKMRRFSVRTWRRRWAELKTGGVAALGQRRRRSDRGRPRWPHAELLQRAEQLKREQPHRSDQVINRILRREFGREVPRSTLYRHLKRVGATRRKLGIVREKIRCRWTRDYSNALWVGDFSHGPVVVHCGQAVKTHLSACIDCHSRYVVEARYYVRENLDILIDSLLRAWARHGASRELYVDNAKIYHAGKLKLATTQLNIKLLHRPPRDAPAGGLIERLFQTLQGQLEAEIRAAEMFSLDQLNAALQAWLRTAYHQEIHSETGQTPQDRYQGARRFTRSVNLQDVIGFFHERASRTVNEDFVDVQVDGQFFQVDCELRGERILVEWDPFQADTGLHEVQLYRLDGTYLGVGKKHHREKREQPPAPSSPLPIKPHYVEALLADAATDHAQSRARGVDYHSAQQCNVWSLTGFAGQFARLLARSGGLSALSAGELEALRAFHARHARLQEGLLREAFSRAETKSIPLVLYHLQCLLAERND